MVSRSTLKSLSVYGCMAVILLGFYDNAIDTSSSSNLRNFSSQLQQKLNLGNEYSVRKLSACPNPEVFPQPTKIRKKCKHHLAEEKFEGGGHEWINVDREIKEEILFHDSRSLINTQYLKVSNRPNRWMGATLKFKESMKECIQANIPYLFRVDIRLETSIATTVSMCSQKEQNWCPRLQWAFKNSKSKRKNMINLSRFPVENSVKDGMWTTWTDVISFPAEFLKGDDDDYGAITINGMEKDVDVSIDSFEILLLPKEYYPDPEAVCDELIVNGDSSLSPFYTYPINSHDLRERLHIVSDASGNYITMNDRKHFYSGPTVELIPGCLRDGAVYKFTSKVRIQADEPIGSEVVIKYADDSGEYKFETIANCPESSKTIDWVECNGLITFSRKKFKNPPFVLSWVTLQNSKNVTDWRDLSLKAITCFSGNADEDVAKECMRDVTVSIDPQADPDTQLVLSTTDKKSNLVFSSKVLLHKSPDRNTNIALASQSFEFELPAGDYIGSFTLGDDTKVWPTFASIKLGDPPKCPNSMNSITLEPPPKSIETCKNLIISGDLEAKKTIVNARWYHNGASMKFVNVEMNKSLSTVRRTSLGHGLFHFLDTGCMILGESYSIHAKFMITDYESEDPVCIPSSKIQGEGCPRANLHAFKRGKGVVYNDNIATTVAPFKVGGWNELYGSFRVGQDINDADKVVFFIDGVKEGVQIVLDDVRIVPSQFDVQVVDEDTDVVESDTQQDENCIKNGDFEVGNSRNWECVGNACAIQMVEGGAPTENGYSNYALSSGPRESRLHGIAQEIDMGCFSLPGIYEVNAKIKLIDSETKQEVFCNPYSYYHGLSDYCPTLLIQVNDPILSNIKIVSGTTVGPYMPNSWNKMYGIVDVTQDMMTWNKMYAYIGMNAKNIEIVVDDVSLTPANRNTLGITTCRQLIKNGSAELGDARFWYIKAANNEHGSVIITPDSGAPETGKYAFYHTGNRTKIYHGMWQEVSKSCMLHETTWMLSAYFKLFDSDDNPVDCDKSGPVGSSGCPIFLLQACNQRACTNKISKNLANENTLPWEMNEWNRYEHKITMDADLVSREKLFISVYGVLPGYRYMVDDISLIKG